MAIVIDFTGEKPRKKTPVSVVSDPVKPAELKQADYKSCTHGRAVIDEEKRTVTCSDCSTILDPFAYILLLYGYYETRVDRRLQAIKEYERRETERRARQAVRRREPRARKIERRAETAECAAYNEYQAKLLAARAERQRQLVERLDREIAE
ncbi:MAG: hypothetical protein V1755_01575 [Chloroflexota bacterium]